MSKTPVKDIIIILPGITGSVLQKNGEDLWAVSGQALWHLVRTQGESLQQLTLEQDDPTGGDLGDGIQATRLVSDAHLVPGLIKIDGYTATSAMIQREFLVNQPDLPPNFFEFPYDWRRSNRGNAHILQKFIQEKLTRWREATGLGEKAKVILLAHSMGGLISRYYVEVLEAWRDCKALFTFGTPHRGSVNAINFLCNGFRKYLLDLTDVMRSFPSIYELLPNYQVVKINNETNYQILSELQEGLPFIETQKLQDAFKFHEDIDKAVQRHLNDPKYLKEFKVIPMVGIKQTTFQSAHYQDGKVSVSSDLPLGIDSLLKDGDGTVPYRSAIPRELTGEYRETYLAQRHGSLQNDPKTLAELSDRIRAMQIDFEPLRGAEVLALRGESPALNLSEIQDYYEKGQEITMKVQATSPIEDNRSIQVAVSSLSSSTEEDPTPVIEKKENGWEIGLNKLQSGLYRVAVNFQTSQTSPITEIFEVIGE